MMKTRVCGLLMGIFCVAAVAQTPAGVGAQSVPQLVSQPVAQAAPQSSPQSPPLPIKANESRQRRQELRNALVARPSQPAQGAKTVSDAERHLTAKERAELREQLRQQRQQAQAGQAKK
jgi:hypothetical protein